MASITLEKVPGELVKYLIKITGDIEPGDDRIFFDKTNWIREGTVILISDGGNLAAGLNIGRQIRSRKLATEVPPLELCASAAALAWLGGVPRIMHTNSGIGFHGAYVESQGKFTVDSAANALIGKYLHEMRLEDAAVRFITEASPIDLQYLGPGEAVVLGIEVQLASGSMPPAEDQQDPYHPYLMGLCEHAAHEFDKAKENGQTGVYLRVVDLYKEALSKDDGNYAMLAYILDSMASDMDYGWMQQHPGLEHLPYNEEEGVQGRAHESLTQLGIGDEGQREGIIASWRMLVKFSQRKLLEILQARTSADSAE